MDKSIYKRLSMFSGIQDNNPDFLECPEYVMPDSDLYRVLNEIFSVDERTGFPKGDIAYYLSPDGNPTVKAWLENNLLKPRAVSGSSVEGLTDDIIAEFKRQPDESLVSYQTRLMGYYDSAVAEIEKSKKSKD